MQKAADLTVAAHLTLMRNLHPAMNERQVAAQIQFELEDHGCERASFVPIVGAGFNSTIQHHSTYDGELRDSDVVVLDFGCEYSYYASDVTRTLPVSGTFTDREREIYNIVLGAENAAIEAFRAGRSTLGNRFADTPDSLYKVAYQYINTHGKDRHGQSLGRYFIHNLGHFVGLDVHDVGDKTKPLDRGMIFTIEPGIYIPEENLGVRIEDVFLVDSDGKLVMLTRSLPRSPEAIEQEIARKRR